MMMDGGTIALDLVIRYGIRTEEGNRNIYTTPIIMDEPTVFGPNFPGVIISHDRMTAYCEKAVYDRITKTISLTGNVYLEDPKGVQKYRIGLITMTGRKPVFMFSK